jgi:hypothetical protein
MAAYFPSSQATSLGNFCVSQPLHDALMIAYSSVLYGCYVLARYYGVACLTDLPTNRLND